jgi:hypothetical protein
MYHAHLKSRPDREIRWQPLVVGPQVAGDTIVKFVDALSKGDTVDSLRFPVRERGGLRESGVGQFRGPRALLAPPLLRQVSPRQGAALASPRHCRAARACPPVRLPGEARPRAPIP